MSVEFVFLTISRRSGGGAVSRLRRRQVPDHGCHADASLPIHRRTHLRAVLPHLLAPKQGQFQHHFLIIFTPSHHSHVLLASSIHLSKRVDQVLPKFIELPGTLSYSALQTYTAESNGAQSCAWLTGRISFIIQAFAKCGLNPSMEIFHRVYIFVQVWASSTVKC